MGKEWGMKKAARGRRTRENRCRETCRSADGRRANRKYKDRLFIRIFEDREDLLCLYMQSMLRIIRVRMIWRLPRWTMRFICDEERCVFFNRRIYESLRASVHL